MHEIKMPIDPDPMTMDWPRAAGKGHVLYLLGSIWESVAAPPKSQVACSLVRLIL